jgi:hypothetical protein
LANDYKESVGGHGPAKVWKAQSRMGLRRAGAFEAMRLFSRTAAGRQKLEGAVDAFPWVQTEAQQDCPLEEVCAGKPYSINRVASFADNLSGHAFPLLKRYTSIFVRKRMSVIINDGPQAITPVRHGSTL